MKTKSEIAAQPELRALGVKANQLEDAGPTEPAGVAIRLTAEQWQEINDRWRRGEQPLGMHPPVTGDVEPERAAELVESMGGSDFVERRQAAVEPEDIDENLVAGPDAEVETVRLANGKSVRVVRGRGMNGLALERPDADDPALRRKPRGGFTPRVFLTRGD